MEGRCLFDIDSIPTRVEKCMVMLLQRFKSKRPFQAFLYATSCNIFKHFKQNLCFVDLRPLTTQIFTQLLFFLHLQTSVKDLTPPGWLNLHLACYGNEVGMHDRYLVLTKSMNPRFLKDEFSSERRQVHPCVSSTVLHFDNHYS